MKQKEAIAILEAGHNVLLTGPAGSGKTFLLNQYIAHLKKNGIGVAVTASTGIAATHIGGRTIHSWSGIGIKDSLSDRELQTLSKRSYLKKQFEKVEVLVIDEISMLNAHCLDMVDAVCQTMKKNYLPFGGIQVVMSGDFFQLPPISPGSASADFVYKAKVWPEMDVRICYLEEQHRQNDERMIRVLKSMRADEVDTEIIDLLNSRLNEKPKEGLHPVRLFTHNVDVDAINKAELEKIDEETFTFQMTAEGERKLVESLKKNCLAPDTLLLKIGAKVMFVKNKFKEEKVIYVNGTTGEVVGFNEERLPLVQIASGEVITVGPDSWTIDDEERVLAKVNQIPLRLAWAITVHKSQGMTLDSAEIDLSRSFGYGMGYVALSRLRSLSGLYLLGINEMAYKLDPEVAAYDRKLLLLSEQARIDLPPKNQRRQGSFLGRFLR